MTGRAPSILGSVIFFVLAPGAVAGLVPYLISGWRFGPPFLGVSAGRCVGALLVVLGVAGLVHCFARFALEGRGTPAPVAPTETLVISGLYQYVRNPMYVAVLSIIVGQAVLFASVSLLGYAVAVWLCFRVFVLAYEEPTLSRRYGPAYDRYRASVPRWLPRIPREPRQA
jgi:protein-S-isoprenylcysteine O-methyltransferase Ste14